MIFLHEADLKVIEDIFDAHADHLSVHAHEALQNVRREVLDFLRRKGVPTTPPPPPRPKP